MNEPVSALWPSLLVALGVGSVDRRGALEIGRDRGLFLIREAREDCFEVGEQGDEQVEGARS